MNKILYTIALLLAITQGAWADGVTDGFSSFNGTTITITSIADMNLIATKVNDGTSTFQGYTFLLNDDLTYDGTENNYTTIGNGSGTTRYFAGTFDGQGHTISGINISAQGRQAVFGTINGATIKNLTLSNSTITCTSSSPAGGIVGYVSGGDNTIENCHVTSINITSNGHSAGGIVGVTTKATLSITGCTSAATISASESAGGILGSYSPGTLNTNDNFKTTITNCLYYGNSLTGTHTSTGAIVGFIDASSENEYSGTSLDHNFYCYPDATIKGIGNRQDKGNNNLTGMYDDTNNYGAVRVRVVTAQDVTAQDITDMGTEGTTTNGMTLYDKGIKYGDTYYSHVLALADGVDNTSILSEYNGMTFDVKLRGRRLYKDGNWNTLCLPFNLSTLSTNNTILWEQNNEGTDIISEVWEMDNTKTYPIQPEEGGSYEDHQTGVSDGKLYLFFKQVEGNEGISAGTPYLVKWKEAEGYNENNLASDHFEPVFTNVEISYDSDYDYSVTSNDRTVKFQSTFAPVSWRAEDRSALLLGAGNTLYYPNGTGISTTVKAFRAYFQLNGVQVAEESGEASGGGDAKVFVIDIEGDADACDISSLKEVGIAADQNASAIYDLQGRRTTSSFSSLNKGIYIRNGKKIAIK